MAAKKLKRKLVTGVSGLPAGDTRVRRTVIHEFDRTRGTSKDGGPKGRIPTRTAPEPLDPDVIVGCVGELRWYWPNDAFDEHDRMVPISDERMGEMDPDVYTEIIPVVERYLNGFSDRTPSDKKVAEAFEQWKHGSLDVGPLNDVCTYMIEMHQPEPGEI